MPTYTIKPGDTLYRISKATGYSVDELANYNRIDPNMIMVGQQLRIPYRFPGEEMSVAVPTSRAEVVDEPIDAWTKDPTELYRQGIYFPGEHALRKFKEDNPDVELNSAQEYIIQNEGYYTKPYYLDEDEKKRGIVTQGPGLTKRPGKDYISLGFEGTYKDRLADLKRKIDSDLVDRLEQKEPEKFAALADLSYRGDVFPKWGKHYSDGDLDAAYKEFWNRKKFGGYSLDRVERNSMILFGKGVPKGTKTSDGKKW